MRPTVLYLRSRHMPASLIVAVGGVAGGWSLNVLVDGSTAFPALMAVLVGVVAASPGLAGADADIDRTAAIAWPRRRAAHLLVAGAAVAVLVMASTLTGHRLGDGGQVVRNAAGLSGLLGFGAVALGASRAWIAPVTWTLLSWTVLARLWPPPVTRTYEQVLTWVVQPAESTPAVVTAVALAVAGVLAYAAVGARSE